MTQAMLLLLLPLFFIGSLTGAGLENEKLITIHGIMGSGWNMCYLVRPLEKDKMNVIHWDYPSREKKIAEHGADLALELRKQALEEPGKPIHFLTHSMGGLVLRAALNHPDCPTEAKEGVAIMIAPPNQGAAWGRVLGNFKLASYIAKDHAGKELMTETNFAHLGSLPDTMKVMVIAGTFSLNFFIPDENDGEVAVAETYLTTPHRHVTIRQGHKSILLSTQAAFLVKEFLLEHTAVPVKE